MSVVVATDAAGEVECRARLAALGVVAARVLDTSTSRRLLIADAGGGAEGVATALRADGIIAVARPDAGVRAESWDRDTAPLTFGAGRLSVCVAWSEHPRPEAAVSVELGTGGFGNGSHPTTRLLLDELVVRIAGGERVLDVGCGSGVLGLAVLGLGASSLVALDLKVSAVEATQRNAVLNGMGDRVQAVLPPLTDVAGPFDVIVANVGRAIAVELASAMVARLAPAGWLAVSGIGPSQATQVVEFLAPLVEIDRRVDGEWAAVTLAYAGG